MARQKRREEAANPAAVKWAMAIILIASALILALAAFGLGGTAGGAFFESVFALFGVGAFLSPIVLALAAWSVVFGRSPIPALPAAGAGLVAISILAILGLLSNKAGGTVGAFLADTGQRLFGFWGVVVLSLAMGAIGTVIAIDMALVISALTDVWDRLRQLLGAVRFPSRNSSAEDENVDIPPDEQAPETEETAEEEVNPVVRVFNHAPGVRAASPAAIPEFGTAYDAPPLSLLGGDRGKPDVGDIKANANVIKRTFQNFGIPVEMDEVSVGPTVTRYAIKPAEGVRLSKIISLQNNLELALAAHPVRIEAPIPGKSLVGIEVPNAAKATVGLGGLLSAPEWGQNKKPLLGALGRDISGTPHYVNISKAPHVLVAGATGSGKTCSKDTYVFSEKGMRTFEELCPLPLDSKVNYAVQVATRDGIEMTSKNYNNGICDFFKITTKDGFSIEVTEEHPLWAIQDGATGWRSGGKIRVGEYVAISRGAKLFGAKTEIDFTPLPNKTNKARTIRLPIRMTRELGLFFGLLTADGGLTIENRIVYTQANEEVLGIYQKLLDDLFGIVAPTIMKSGASNLAMDVIVHSKNLKDFLTHLGVKPVGAKEKEMPLSIRQAGPEVIAAFIQGLIRNDGHVSSLGLEITLANEKLLKQLQIVLLNFGVVSSIRPKKVKEYEQNTYWRLAIYGVDFVTYAAEIGFLTDEERRKAERICARKRNTNKNTVPTLAPILKKLSLLYRLAFARLTNAGWQYHAGALVPKYAFNNLRSYGAGIRNPSYHALERILAFYEPLAESVEYRKIATIRENNFYWAKVEKIERTQGVGYDFEVPGSNSFVGNGFVNHNSVAIHALITSLLYRNGPNELRFIMVDPKRVELTAYNGIPHLLTPVITDPKKTILALKWAAKEMERRYNVLEAESVRDIGSYHASVVEPNRRKRDADAPEAMPYIIIVIDELADIMHSYPRELEAAVVRLAQMSRAVGIHLVLSTQRPSVNVITGLIKANVPTRLALQVASQVDSRTILDGSGAEHLLGAGDMLYLSSDMQKPVRIQTAYIGESEVKKVVRYIREHNAGDLSSLDLAGNASRESENGGVSDVVSIFDESDDVDDDLYQEARAAVEEAGRASTSYLQRKLRIGYSRAARLMDLLEERGIIGPADGSRPREILSSGGHGSGRLSEEENAGYTENA